MRIKSVWLQKMKRMFFFLHIVNSLWKLFFVSLLSCASFHLFIPSFFYILFIPCIHILYISLFLPFIFSFIYFFLSFFLPCLFVCLFVCLFIVYLFILWFGIFILVLEGLCLWAYFISIYNIFQSYESDIIKRVGTTKMISFKLLQTFFESSREW